MRQEDYPPGTIVFAKLKGYPWWPARVEDEKLVPAKVLKHKKTTKSKGPVWTVFFFGSKDYGFFGPDAIRPFDSENVERDLTAKKFKTKELEKAVRQALDPSLFQKEEDEDDEGEGEDEKQSDEEETDGQKGAKNSRRTRTSRKSASTPEPSSPLPSTKKKSTTTTLSSRKSKNSSSNVKKEEEEEGQEEEETPVKTKRRSRKLDEMTVKKAIESDDNGRKKRHKLVSLEKEEGHTSPAASSRHSDESSSEKPREESAEYEKERKRMYFLRHKLQKLVYQKNPGEISKNDYGAISTVLKNVEDARMTPRLLRDTKIGQVVKSAGQYVFEDDVEYNIQARARQLMARWRESFASARQAANGKTTQESGKAAIPASTATATSENNSENAEAKYPDTMQVDSPVPAAEENKADEDNEESGIDAMVIDEAASVTAVSANVVDTVMHEAH